MREAEGQYNPLPCFSAPPPLKKRGRPHWSWVSPQAPNHCLVVVGIAGMGACPPLLIPFLLLLLLLGGGVGLGAPSSLYPTRKEEGGMQGFVQIHRKA